MPGKKRAAPSTEASSRGTNSPAREPRPPARAGAGRRTDARPRWDEVPSERDDVGPLEQEPLRSSTAADHGVAPEDGAGGAPAPPAAEGRGSGRPVRGRSQ